MAAGFPAARHVACRHVGCGGFDDGLESFLSGWPSAMRANDAAHEELVHIHAPVMASGQPVWLRSAGGLDLVIADALQPPRLLRHAGLPEMDSPAAVALIENGTWLMIGTDAQMAVQSDIHSLHGSSSVRPSLCLVGGLHVEHSPASRPSFLFEALADERWEPG